MAVVKSVVPASVVPRSVVPISVVPKSVCFSFDFLVSDEFSAVTNVERSSSVFSTALLYSAEKFSSRVEISFGLTVIAA